MPDISSLLKNIPARKLHGVLPMRHLEKTMGIAGGFASLEMAEKQLAHFTTTIQSTKTQKGGLFAIRSGLKSIGLGRKEFSEYIYDQKQFYSHLKMARDSGLAGLIMVDPTAIDAGAKSLGISRFQATKSVIIHEKQHYNNKLVDFQGPGKAKIKVPTRFENGLRSHPHYSKQIEAIGESTIADEYLAYSIQGSKLKGRALDIHSATNGLTIEEMQQGTKLAKIINQQAKVMLRRSSALYRQETNMGLSSIDNKIIERSVPLDDIMYSSSPPNISNKLKLRPTAGFVNHVLDNPEYRRRHTQYAGKSY